MKLDATLRCLGADRVIWIDDHFNETPPLLAHMLVANLELTEACAFPEFARAFAEDTDDADPAGAIQAVLETLEQVRRDEMTEIFLRRQQEAEGVPTRELPTGIFERACALLGVHEDDRWSFQGYQAKLRTAHADGDGGIAYIVDLKDTDAVPGAGKRGLDVLRNLAGLKSKATAFILTHEATIAEEAQRETEYQADLRDLGVLSGVPICVVSKQRLADGDIENEEMEEVLRVAVKRAGLRKSVHEVLVRAEEEVKASFRGAAEALLRVTPEKLDDHVVERGYQEGVSELHVIERALTARMSQQIRTMFGHDPQVRLSIDRLRNLRAVPLRHISDAPDPDLTAFRKAEIWEGEELINAAFAPIACGDVFEIDTSEASTKTVSKRRFILIGQPCDLMLRPGKSRMPQTGILIPLKVKPSRDAPAARDGEADEGAVKSYPLPFTLDDEALVCDLREAAPVQLSILDLASFRADGFVRFERGQKAVTGLLPGQGEVFAAWASKANRIMPPEGEPATTFDEAARRNTQLTFAASAVFKHVAHGTYEPGTTTKANRVTTTTLDRLTWRLRRCGRVRMPYAGAILDRYVGSISRHAFDLDYMLDKRAAPTVVPHAPLAAAAEAGGGA
ncbi:hypothetical protein [Methylobacterium oryzae]|uniref:Uncharacterized protein n=1 Tax=Methylobacterium oryzae TaxID=334852 RepID=A0ABU7TRQ0_9HYPH